MELKFGVATMLCKYSDLTKFDIWSGHFLSLVDLKWNDPSSKSLSVQPPRNALAMASPTSEIIWKSGHVLCKLTLTTGDRQSTSRV